MTDTATKTAQSSGFEVPESFHRTKRTLLLFCTALAVTRIPGIDVTSHSGLLGVSFKAVDIDLIRWLLLGAASYYFVGTLLEGLALRHSNAGALSLERVRGVSALITFAQARLAEKDEDVVILADKLRAVLSKTRADAEQTAMHASLLRGKVESANKGVDSPGILSGEIVGLNQMLTNIERWMAETETAPALVAEAEGRVNDSLKDLEMFLERLRMDVNRLQLRVVGSRWLHFYGWELGAAVVMFLTAIAASPIFSELWK